MHRLLLVFCLLLPPTAPLSGQSCVWKINQGGNTLYLGGTIHVLRKADLPLPPEFDVAFAATEATYFETDIARLQTPETLRILMTEGVYPAGQSLESTLTPEAWQAVQNYCQQAGLAPQMMERFKPWMFVMNVSLLEMQKIGVSEQGVDLIYHKKSVAAGKTVGGLESYETQMGYLTRIGAGHESEMILQQLKELGRMQTMLEGMIASWRAGDLAKIDEMLSREMRAESPEIYDELIVQRNRNWLPELEKLLRSDPVEFVLVGAGHLAGTDGLIAALQARGCAVEQIVAAR